ncbi:MAG: ATP-binding cassette domain-containing protein [Kineosporiaceae bacterium]
MTSTPGSAADVDGAPSGVRGEGVVAATRGLVPLVRRRVRERLSAARHLLRLVRQVRRPTLAALIGVHVVAGLAPIGVLVAVGFALGAAVRGTGTGWPLALAAVAFVVGRLVVPLQVQLSAQAAREVDAWCSVELARLALLRTSLPALEDGRVQVSLSDATQALTLQRLTPGMAAEAAVGLLARYLPMLGAVVVLALTAGTSVALAALGVALVGRLATSEAFARWGRVVVELRAQRRRVAYVRDLATGTSAAKEIRTLGLIDWLDARFRHDHGVLAARLWRRRRAIFGVPFLVVAGVSLLGTAAALGVLAVSAAADVSAAGIGVSTDGEALAAAVASAVMAVQAVALCVRFGVMFGEADLKLVYGRAAWEGMVQAEQLAAGASPEAVGTPDEAAAASPAPGAVRQDVPRPEHELRLSRVSFAYPGAGTPVLRGLDLVIRAGTSVAVVGANGAGKTTLVKLLTGLYTPTAGRVLADAADVAGFDPRAWQSRFAVTFQDFVRYPTSLRENVAMNAVAHLDDDEGVRDCLERAGLRGLVDDLDGDAAGQGLDVPLTHLVPGGRDLSGGQWQRVALARALFAVRHGASILVLDEPTAALDARGEAEFYDAFLDLTAGVTSVVVSHRFSTVRRADSIVVLDGGRVAEQGTHEELLFAGGRYASMFTAQARRFAVGGPR